MERQEEPKHNVESVPEWKNIVGNQGSRFEHCRIHQPKGEYSKPSSNPRDQEEDEKNVGDSFLLHIDEELPNFEDYVVDIVGNNDKKANLRPLEFIGKMDQANRCNMVQQKGPIIASLHFINKVSVQTVPIETQLIQGIQAEI